MEQNSANNETRFDMTAPVRKILAYIQKRVSNGTLWVASPHSVHLPFTLISLESIPTKATIANRKHRLRSVIGCRPRSTAGQPLHL